MHLTPHLSAPSRPAAPPSSPLVRVSPVLHRVVVRESQSECLASSSAEPGLEPSPSGRGVRGVATARRADSATGSESPRRQHWKEAGRRQQHGEEAGEWEPRTPSAPARAAVRSSIAAVRGLKSIPNLTVTSESDLGRSAGFVRHYLSSEGKVLLISREEEGLWQAFRVLRCARTMLVQAEGTMPVFQPVQLQHDGNGLRAGAWVCHTEKVLAGPFSISSALRVRGPARAELQAAQLAARVAREGCCMLDSQGKAAALACLKIIHLARRRLLRQQMDMAVALDPVVVPVPEGGAMTTMQNRFMLMQCAVNRPAQLQVKVSMRMRTSRY